MSFRLRPKESTKSRRAAGDRKSTRLNSSHSQISYAVFCLKKNNDHSSEHDKVAYLCNLTERCVLAPCVANGVYPDTVTVHFWSVDCALTTQIGSQLCRASK